MELATSTTATNLLDTTINEMFSKKGPKKPAFGVELELENFHLNQSVPWEYLRWAYKAEPSLRNDGIELVSNPILFSARSEAWKEMDRILQKAWTGTKPIETIRCSTHVHINVSYLTFRQLYNVLIVYYFFENLLVRTQPDARVGNLFCLRLADAQRIGYNLFRVIKEPWDFPSVFTKNNSKYAALNLATIPMFNTIEFRFLRPIMDTELLNFWVEIFQGLVDFGVDLKKPGKFFELYEENTVRDLLSIVFGVSNGKRLYKMIEERYSNEIQITRAVHKNYDTCFEIKRLLEANKYEVPEVYWDPDLNLGVRPRKGRPIKGLTAGAINFATLDMAPAPSDEGPW